MVVSGTTVATVATDLTGAFKVSTTVPKLETGTYKVLATLGA